MTKVCAVANTDHSSDVAQREYLLKTFIMSKRTIVRRPESGKLKGEKPLPRKSDEPDLKTEKQLQLMCLRAGHWKSDLEFFQDELNFFRKLIDKYFIRLVDEKNIDKTRTLVASLVMFEKTRHSLNQRIADHLKHMTRLIENPFSSDGQKSKDEHDELELAIAEFVKGFRQLKKEIFQLTESVMESEKISHLLGS